MDVPHTALSKGLNGIHVIGWGGCAADQEFGTWPTSYARDLLERWGSHPVGWDCGRGGDGPSEWAGLRDKLVSAVQARAAMAGSILASEAWDFVFYVFSEAHCAGHNCWHLHDHRHPRYTSQMAATVEPRLRNGCLRATGPRHREHHRAGGRRHYLRPTAPVMAWARITPVTICSTRSWPALRAGPPGRGSGRLGSSGPQHCGASRGRRAGHRPREFAAVFSPIGTRWS